MIRNYEKEVHRRKLTVKLKNAIMVYWLEVKDARSKPSMEEIIQGLIKKKREEGTDEKEALEAKKKARKERREIKRLEALEKKKNADSAVQSYISKDQFNFLYDSIFSINDKMSKHSSVVDELEKNLLEVLEDNAVGIDPKRLRLFIYQIIKGVTFCHKNYVVHRDIKPENILLDSK